jgi:hypothetical protein
VVVEQEQPPQQHQAQMALILFLAALPVLVVVLVRLTQAHQLQADQVAVAIQTGQVFLALLEQQIKDTLVVMGLVALAVHTLAAVVEAPVLLVEALILLLPLAEMVVLVFSHPLLVLPFIEQVVEVVVFIQMVELLVWAAVVVVEMLVNRFQATE